MNPSRRFTCLQGILRCTRGLAKFTPSRRLSMGLNVPGNTNLTVKRLSTILTGMSGGFFLTYLLNNDFPKLQHYFMASCSEESDQQESGLQSQSRVQQEHFHQSFDGQNQTNSNEEVKSMKVKLFQYHNCPFCCKVRAFLDYYGIEYEKVEVNPLLKKEIKFSEYRKVPIAMVDGQQLNDSSLIVSIVRSYMLGKGSLEELLVYYPKIESGDKKKSFEYQNRHNVMYLQAMPTKEKAAAVGEEAKWRKWVDHTLVHMLSPNIYRTMAESYQAFEYFSDVGNFSAFDRFLAKNCGAIFMFLISKNLKKRYRLQDDVRQSLYEEANNWVKGIGKKRKFMGGDKPNLADLAVYGVLSAIEGLDAFNDMMANSDIKPWYNRIKKAVTSHQGQQEYLALMKQQST